MRRDQLLVEIFLRGYNENFGTTFQVLERPEDINRKTQAIEAIAQSHTGLTLAIEHTLLQPFVGEKDDAQSFLKVFTRLEQDETLRVPNRSIYLSVPMGAVPNRQRWDKVATAVEEWFRQNRLSIPDGKSTHSIPNLPFELSVSIHKTPISYPEGRVLVGRSLVNDNFPDVVEKALKTKLPKLIGTRADRHMLLLELDNTPRHPGEITEAILSLQQNNSGIGNVNEIWCAQTQSWETEGIVDFYRAWPASAAEWPQFRLSTQPTARQPTINESRWRFIKFTALLPVFWFVLVFAAGLASRQLSIPDNARWDWIIRIAGIILAVPACWLVVGAKEQAAVNFTAQVASLFVAVSYLLYSAAVIAGIVAFVMVFAKGSEWVYGAMCLPNIRLASITVWMIVPVALFMCLFKRARLAGSTVLFLSSIICGFSLWVYSLYVAATISLMWMVIGVVCLGLGVIPVAIIGSCVKGAWSVASFIVVGAAIVTALRYGGRFGLHKASHLTLSNEGPAEG